MKKRRLLTLIGSICIVLALAMALPAPSQAREQVAIEILSMGFGGSGYVASFALSDLINKHSPWLRATCIQTGGSIENLKTLNAEPKRRKNTIIYGSWIAPYLSSKGLPPFTAKYGGARALSLAMNVVCFFATLDPNIKTGKDIAGKRVGFPPKASIGYINQQMVMKYAWNVWDTIKKEFLGWTACINALRDGMVDVAIANPIMAGDTALPNPALVELLAGAKKVYWIPITEDDLKIVREKSGYPLGRSLVCPAGALGPKQPNAVEGGRAVNNWWADVEFPNDAAYEVCRIIKEHYKAFWPYHASLKGLNPEMMGKAGSQESYFHPGAVKFYKEQGLKIGW